MFWRALRATSRHSRSECSCSSRALSTLPSTADHSQPEALSLDVPAYLVWGANTDVGKTLVCAGLAAAAARSRVRGSIT